VGQVPAHVAWQRRVVLGLFVTSAAAVVLLGLAAAALAFAGH
jgi:hypothetical protein